MSDLRHGTVAGYNRIPCRDDCCKLAMSRYKKRHEWDRLNGRERIVSTLGTRRRVQALARLGWPNAVIAREAGVYPPNMSRLLYRSDTMTATVAARFAEVYERLSMRLPEPSTYVTRARRRAEREGWPPPLAWDDIDHDEKPHGIRDSNRRDLLTEWAELREAGESIDQAARRLGVTVKAIEKAAERQQKKGDAA